MQQTKSVFICINHHFEFPAAAHALLTRASFAVPGRHYFLASVGMSGGESEHGVHCQLFRVKPMYFTGGRTGIGELAWFNILA